MRLNCAGHPDPEIFFDVPRWPEAAKVCSGCPARLQCATQFASDPYAFAGGMIPAERIRWARRQKYAGRTLSKTPKKRASKVPPETAQMILRLFDEGLAQEEISREVELARSTVRRVLLQHGRSRTPEENAELARRNRVKATGGRDSREAVLALLAEGRKAKEVAATVGLTVGHVWAIKRKAQQ